MLYYLKNCFNEKNESTGRTIEYILNICRYFNEKDIIVSTDYRYTYKVKMIAKDPMVANDKKKILLYNKRSGAKLLYIREKGGIYKLQEEVKIK